MTQEEQETIPIIIFAAFVTLLFVSGMMYQIGKSYGIQEVRNQAVRQGVATFDVNSHNVVEFKWKTQGD